MKKLCLLISICVAIHSSAQQNKNKVLPHGNSNSISVGANVAIGNFWNTHPFGIGVAYSWSNHRFGETDSIPSCLFGFTGNAGIDYYFGKEESVGAFKYKYSNYIFFHTYGGVILTASKKISMELTTGPLLGLYKSTTQFGFALNLNGSFYVSQNMAITPSVQLFKLHRSDALYTGALKLTYCF
jgi:hypothetical protein